MSHVGLHKRQPFLKLLAFSREHFGIINSTILLDYWDYWALRGRCNRIIEYKLFYDYLRGTKEEQRSYNHIKSINYNVTLLINKE